MRHLCTPALLLASVAGCSAPSSVSNTAARSARAPDPATSMIAGSQTTGPTSPSRDATQTGKVPATAVAESARLTVDPDGLRWFLPPNGSARPLPFGTSQAAVLASVERLRGKARQGTNADCGAGPLEVAAWPDGLTLHFEAGKFVGWALSERASGAIATADGIGPGSTRAALDDAIGAPLDVRQTSLGTEFTAGAYHGLLDGTGSQARITYMWTGLTCVVR